MENSSVPLMSKHRSTSPHTYTRDPDHCTKGRKEKRPGLDKDSSEAHMDAQKPLKATKQPPDPIREFSKPQTTRPVNTGHLFPICEWWVGIRHFKCHLCWCWEAQTFLWLSLPRAKTPTKRCEKPPARRAPLGSLAATLLLLGQPTKMVGSAQCHSDLETDQVVPTLL